MSINNCLSSFQWGPEHEVPCVCLHQLLEQQAASHPLLTCAVHDDTRLTLGELNAAANQVAWKLIDEGIKPGDFVGVQSSRTIYMVIAMFGILKAGGTYLPIDPEHNEERLKRIIEKSQPDGRILIAELLQSLSRDTS